MKKWISKPFEIVTPSVSSQILFFRYYRSRNIKTNTDKLRNRVEEKPFSSSFDLSATCKGLLWGRFGARDPGWKFPISPKIAYSLSHQHKLCKLQLSNCIQQRTEQFLKTFFASCNDVQESNKSSLTGWETPR